MPINFEPDVIRMSGAIIKVIGVGGGGSNAVNHMFRQGIEGVEFFVCNTDAQALLDSPVQNRIQLGIQLTEGLGAGSEPEMGRKAALESVGAITDILRSNTKMVFVTAGMGGGTGTGAAPVIAKISKELGILTVGIVTIPFEDEGPDRIAQAMAGIDNLKPHVDALLTISNDRIVNMYGDLAVSLAFAKADDILCTAAKGIAEIITKPGKLNVDFKDVQTAMTNSGRAIMGTGVASGTERAEEAVKMALDSPLLDNTRISRAKHLLVNFTYGTKEPTMGETAKVKRYLQEEAGHTAHLKMGITHDSKLGEEISITVIATGFEVHAPAGMPQQVISQNTVTAEPEAHTQSGFGQIPVPVDLDESPVTEFMNPFQPELDAPTMLEKPDHRKGVLDNMEIPAYLRRSKNLFQAPNSDNNQVNRVTIAETTEEVDQVVKPNRHLHDNVD